jgi:catechol 2,3-dioxygenase-like lactoylglutathione lyase family enzyme
MLHGMELAHTMLRVRDLDRSLAFYTGFLGLEEVRRSRIVARPAPRHRGPREAQVVIESGPGA